MVKKEFCDRCGEEIKVISDNPFDEMFDDVASHLNKKSLVLIPHLCPSCKKEYEKIISKTNKEIEKFLENKDNKPKKKKFGLF